MIIHNNRQSQNKRNTHENIKINFSVVSVSIETKTQKSFLYTLITISPCLISFNDNFFYKIAPILLLKILVAIRLNPTFKMVKTKTCGFSAGRLWRILALFS